MAKKVTKTNAVRMIEQQKITYELLRYNIEERGNLNGATLSEKAGYPVDRVYKTLVTTSGVDRYHVFVVPVTEELDLKKTAKIVGQKKVELIPVKELLGLTGYVRGGCSPIGMRKMFPTYIDASAEALDYIIVSAGKVGMSLKLAPKDLAKVSKARFEEILL